MTGYFAFRALHELAYTYHLVAVAAAVIVMLWYESGRVWRRLAMQS